MAAVSKNLHLLRDKIRRSKLVTDSEILIFVVFEIQRYLVDPDYKAHTGLGDTSETELYDLTLTDGDYKLKCLLSPTLNHLVQRHELHAGSLIGLQPCDCHSHCNDLSLNDDPFIVLNQVDVRSDYAGAIDNPDFCSFCAQRERDNIPMVTGRGTYLPMWNIEDPVGLPWKQLDSVSDNFPSTDRCITVAELSEKWKRLQRPYKTLVVRVLNKSRLRMYGKRDRRDKWPYQLYLEIADETGICGATIWCALCLDLLYSVHEGSLLMISSYTVRQRYQLMSRPSCRNKLTRYDIEIGLDKRNPSVDVIIIDPQAVSAQWRLPPLQGEFFNRRLLGSLPDQYNCDIVGVVLHVGRYNRTRKGQDGQFWCYRWLHLIDPSSPRPIIVQLFATSQPTVQISILPGRVLIITQMRLIHNIHTISNSRQQRALHVTTTNESQVTIVEDDVPNHWSTDPIVMATVDWRKSSVCQNLLLRKTSLGGYQNYSCLPTCLEDYKELRKDGSMELTSAAALKDRLLRMCFRETAQINVQGKLLSVQYHANTTHKACETRSPPNLDAPATSHQPDIVSPLVHKLRSGHTVKSRLTTTDRNLPTHAGTSKRKRSDKNIPADEALSTERDLIVIDELCESIVGTAYMCGQRDISSTMLSRAYSFKNGPAVYKTCMAMPSGSYKHRKTLYLQDIPVRPQQDYLTLIISGLNQQVAIIAHVLLPIILPPDVTIVRLLSGQSQSSTSDLAQSHDERRQIIDQMMKTSFDLMDKRLLFVLDAYCYDNCEELVVNRAFVVDR